MKDGGPAPRRLQDVASQVDSSEAGDCSDGRHHTLKGLEILIRRQGEGNFENACRECTINLPPVVRGDILGVEEDATVVES